MPTLKTITNRHVNRQVHKSSGISQAKNTTGSGQTRKQRALFSEYQFEPSRYIEDKLGWSPWSGNEDGPGQQQIIDAYNLALKQQFEKRDFEAGTIGEKDLTVWSPGVVIQNRIRVEAGHTVGKTKLFSGLVNHFFDCFPPALVYTFAPTWLQIHDLLWKEIKSDRRDKGLPGRILDLALTLADNHFAVGRATSDSSGKGTERVQGQHGEYLLFVLDEAEGIPDFVFNAVKSMTSGGISIVLMAANPRTRASTFYKQKELSNVASFRISCVNHPNVVHNREIVPGAVKRDYIQDMIDSNAEPVDEHNEDNHTFMLPFPIVKSGKEYPAGQIWEPDPEFLFRVMGIAPANSSDNTFVPVGRYEAACKREEKMMGSDLRIGVDCARWGNDYGTVWARRGNHVWRHAKLIRLDGLQYVGSIRQLIMTQQKRGARSVHVRIDAGGGFGSTQYDLLKNDAEFKRMFGEENYACFEVNFNGTAQNPKGYHDMVTQLYAEVAETIKGVCIKNAPKELEADLTERKYLWANLAGVAVKKLEPKDDFRKRQFRSPDDGDGLVMACAPDYLFRKRKWNFG